MDKKDLIETLEKEKDYCEEMMAKENHKGNEALSIMWKGKFSGLKLALEYVMSLDD